MLKNERKTVNFKKVSPKDLSDGDYTLVTLVVDESPSVMSFKGLLEQSVKHIVDSLKEKIKNSDNLIVKTVAFSIPQREVHPFSRLSDCNSEGYNNLIRYGNGTALRDASFHALNSMRNFAAKTKSGVNINSFLFLLTDGEDNSSKKTHEELKSKFQSLRDKGPFESLSSVLVGVGIHNGYSNPALRMIKKAGFDGYIGLKETNAEAFGKLSNFISRCIESQSDAVKINDPFRKGYSDRKTMEVNGLKCTLHMPKIKNKDEGGLPPFAPRPAFAVDEYKNSPTSWMHGSATESSYFVPVAPEHGLWLDFEDNRDNEYDISVVVSIQGVNPITGEKSDPIRLEQYKKMCPKHQKEFKQDRLCEDCKYKWHPQNYLTSTADSPMWLDGWRTQDGEIRQWYFSEEECKSIAGQIIGDDRVYAIGVAFYKSKNKKANSYHEYYGYGGAINLNSRAIGSSNITLTGGAGGFSSLIGAINVLGGSVGGGSSGSNAGGGGSSGSNAGGDGSHCAGNVSLTKGADFTHQVLGRSNLSAVPDFCRSDDSITIQCNAVNDVIDSCSIDIGAITNSVYCDTTPTSAIFQPVEITQKKLEIAAGAKIEQEIAADPNDLDYWEEEAAGFIYINYCDLDTADKILAVGKHEELKEGFLANLVE